MYFQVGLGALCSSADGHRRIPPMPRWFHKPGLGELALEHHNDGLHGTQAYLGESHNWETLSTSRISRSAVNTSMATWSWWAGRDKAPQHPSRDRLVKPLRAPRHKWARLARPRTGVPPTVRLPHSASANNSHHTAPPGSVEGTHSDAASLPPCLLPPSNAGGMLD